MKPTVDKKRKNPKPFKPVNPAEADLLRGVELAFDVTVDSLQKELVKIVQEGID